MVASLPTSYIKAYHGTSQNNSFGIRQKNFLLGGEDHWFGLGAYFFVEGVSCEEASKDAENWARFDGRRKGYRQWSVMQADVSTENHLDLTDQQQLKFFNGWRKLFRKTIKCPGPECDPYAGIDLTILEKLREKRKISSLKANIYSKFNPQTYQISSRLPNVTILCVYEPDDVIPRNRILEHSTGRV
jgi:hypothetical protein